MVAVSHQLSAVSHQPSDLRAEPGPCFARGYAGQAAKRGVKSVGIE